MYLAEIMEQIKSNLNLRSQPLLTHRFANPRYGRLRHVFVVSTDGIGLPSLPRATSTLPQLLVCNATPPLLAAHSLLLPTSLCNINLPASQSAAPQLITLDRVNYEGSEECRSLFFDALKRCHKAVSRDFPG